MESNNLISKNAAKLTERIFLFSRAADLPSFGGAWSQNWYAYLRRNWENCFRELLDNANELTSLMRVHAPMTLDTSARVGGHERAIS